MINDLRKAYVYTHLFPDISVSQGGIIQISNNKIVNVKGTGIPFVVAKMVIKSCDLLADE